MVRILCVEDNLELAHQLTDLLKAERYTVDLATDGQEGWELVEFIHYDLILLDITLPKLDGLQLCQKIRDRGKSVPIMLLTARGTSGEKVVGLDAGADDYLVKPFGIRELTARIRALLRRGQNHLSPTILEWGDFRLNPSTHEVTYGDQPLQPSPKEYALLELFLRNSRQTFSRSLILDRLWSLEGDMPGEDTVKCHIKGLRSRLKAVGAGDLIETLYGLGYRLNPNFLKTHSSPVSNQKKRFTRPADSPIVLLVTSNSASETLRERHADCLCQMAIEQGIQVIISNHHEVNAKLQEFCPQLLIVDLDAFTIADLSRLREITSIPMIAWANESHTLDDRLAVAQLKSVTWLPKTTSLTQTITLIHQALRSPTPSKILWLDDASLTASLLTEISNLSRYRINRLNDPQQFWETLQTFQPDLLILSAVSPISMTLCQALRNDLVRRKTPVIMLNTSAEITPIAGVDDCLPLSINTTALIARIDYHLDRHE
jgi:DNA-binding response OmpR family regulator